MPYINIPPEPCALAYNAYFILKPYHFTSDPSWTSEAQTNSLQGSSGLSSRLDWRLNGLKGDSERKIVRI